VFIAVVIVFIEEGHRGACADPFRLPANGQGCDYWCRYSLHAFQDYLKSLGIKQA
jgi:hypothetical protein